MTTKPGWLHRQLPGIIALVLVVTTFMVARLPESSAAEKTALAKDFKFTAKSIAMPSGFAQQEVRKVNKDYKHIDAWISSVGAAIAMNDVDGDGLPNDLCITDPRIDQVVVTPVPDKNGHRYPAFALNPGSLPMNGQIAPMGCLPGDYNEDGRTDLLVYYWGRTPIIFLTKPEAKKLDAECFTAVELVPGKTGGAYDGPQWNSNAVTYEDFDGDGHYDILITNYFPHGPVLDDRVSGGVEMNDSMSDARNGGEDYFFLANGDGSFRKVDDALPVEVSKGWELGAASADIDGDGLPELHLANDFGPDHLLHNKSTPGKLAFEEIVGGRSPVVPKSKVIGQDSFKGMGEDFADLDGDGLYDLFVSNITTSWGIEESNFHFLTKADNQADLRSKLLAGEAPFDDVSGSANTAWSGWGWDVKAGDFTNSGTNQVVQATGFVRGYTNRWPQLQELATANDELLTNPSFWPNVTLGDDVGGDHTMKFFVKGADGNYDDLAPELGLAIPVPTRGVATGDADGDGRLDFAMARQWDQPVFYQNNAPNAGHSLTLCLFHDAPTADGAPGSPVVGAQVVVTKADGTKVIGRVDGGGGHSGKRSNDVHIGLGDDAGPVQVHITWRDRAGQRHEQDLQLTSGMHALRLGTQAKEK
ncbi:CRTAC1 family protein [Actinokineospora sp.]|uniref:CRTAC1 family protein n=1 Tax=Actinokineospora sp. TaxID=1872133 RepID=UPI003D6AF477